MGLTFAGFGQKTGLSLRRTRAPAFVGKAKAKTKAKAKAKANRNVWSKPRPAQYLQDVGSLIADRSKRRLSWKLHVLT